MPTGEGRGRGGGRGGEKSGYERNWRKGGVKGNGGRKGRYVALGTREKRGKESGREKEERDTGGGKRIARARGRREEKVYKNNA